MPVRRNALHMQVVGFALHGIADFKPVRRRRPVLPLPARRCTLRVDHSIAADNDAGRVLLRSWRGS
jgi:hypothetical protein